MQKQKTFVEDQMSLYGWGESTSVMDAIQAAGGTQNLSKEIQSRISQMNAAAMNSTMIKDVLTGIKEDNSFGQRLASGVLSIGTSVVSGVLTGALTGLLAAGVSKLLDAAVGKITGRDEIEKLEKGQNATDANNQFQKELEEAEKTTTNLAKRYSELRKGVEMEGGAISNISLSTEEFDEFLSINKQLSDMYPTLVTGVTSHGDALVDLGEKAEDATKKLQEMYNVNKQETVDNMRDNMIDMATANDIQVDRIQDEIKELEQGMKEYEEVRGMIEGTSDWYTKPGEYTQSLTGATKYSQSVRQALEKAFDENGLNYDFDFATNAYKVAADTSEKQMQAIRRTVMNETQNMQYDYVNDQAKVALNKTKMQSVWSEYANDLATVLDNDPAFIRMMSEMGEDFQSGFNTALANLDFNSLYDAYQKSEDESSMEFDEYIIDKFVRPF